MADDLWDFDAGWAEAEEKPLRVKFMGKIWELPSDTDAENILIMDRAMAAVARGDEEAAGKVLEAGGLSIESMARRFATDEIVDQWLELHPGSRRLAKVVRDLTEYYRGNQKPESTEDAAPNRHERRAEAAQARKKPARKSPSSSATGAR